VDQQQLSAQLSQVCSPLFGKQVKRIENSTSLHSTSLFSLNELLRGLNAEGKRNLLSRMLELCHGNPALLGVQRVIQDNYWVKHVLTPVDTSSIDDLTTPPATNRAYR
jgi:hypothetical protein